MRGVAKKNATNSPTSSNGPKGTFILRFLRDLKSFGKARIIPLSEAIHIAIQVSTGPCKKSPMAIARKISPSPIHSPFENECSKPNKPAETTRVIAKLVMSVTMLLSFVAIKIARYITPMPMYEYKAPEGKAYHRASYRKSTLAGTRLTNQSTSDIVPNISFSSNGQSRYDTTNAQPTKNSTSGYAGLKET